MPENSGVGLHKFHCITFYSETGQNRTSLGPTFVFVLDRCSVYTS